MGITITLHWWMLPALITIVAVTFAMTKEKMTGHIGDGLETIFWLVPSLGISCISWIIYAIFK